MDNYPTFTVDPKATTWPIGYQVSAARKDGWVRVQIPPETYPRSASQSENESDG